MPDDSPQDQNIYHIVTKLIKFVVVYSNMIGSIDILHHNKMIVTKWTEHCHSVPYFVCIIHS
jgi:hypothetical protein